MVWGILSSALDRESQDICKVLGGSVNSGGQRGSGVMSGPNNVAANAVFGAYVDAASWKECALISLMAI